MAGKERHQYYHSTLIDLSYEFEHQRMQLSNNHFRIRGKVWMTGIF